MTHLPQTTPDALGLDATKLQAAYDLLDGCSATRVPRGRPSGWIEIETVSAFC